MLFFFFFFNATATTELYTLSLHDALPISSSRYGGRRSAWTSSCSRICRRMRFPGLGPQADRKSTRLNSSHLGISYAVFCLKKKKKKQKKRKTLNRHTVHKTH